MHYAALYQQSTTSIKKQLQFSGRYMNANIFSHIEICVLYPLTIVGVARFWEFDDPLCPVLITDNRFGACTANIP